MFSFLKKHLPYVQTEKAISTMFVLAHIRTQSKVPFHKKLFFPSLQQFSGRKTTIAKHTLKLCCFFLTQLCRCQNCIKAWKFHFPEVDWEESSSVTHCLNEIPKQALLPAQRRVPPLRSTTGGRPGWQHPGKSCQPSPASPGWAIAGITARALCQPFSCASPLMANRVQALAVCDVGHLTPFDYKHRWKLPHQQAADIPFKMEKNAFSNWNHCNHYQEHCDPFCCSAHSGTTSQEVKKMQPTKP